MLGYLDFSCLETEIGVFQSVAYERITPSCFSHGNLPELMQLSGSSDVVRAIKHQGAPLRTNTCNPILLLQTS